ncbi:hypothetical protein FA95DRAFT_1574808 [Auriscalpium vulgare]|uniref:Uncharacterized protein n=1 Tax=Auriscalpium vulgare TaxID=40419 RepID=A0ACB8RJV0_9AGAM|nr:hypothetical protein FA95DRAFT_1574808 [Auriscalpium vulgare]
MSFFQDPKSGELVRDMWPGGVGRVSVDQQDSGDMHDWQIVPNDLEDRSRQNTFVHIQDENIEPDQDETSPARLYQVTFRMQGYLGDHNLAVLGDWDGTEESACKATQHLMLEPGALEHIFAIQRSSLNNIPRFILRQLGCIDNTKQDIEASKGIYLGRRVWTKVTQKSQPAPSVLLPIDDPLRRAHRMRSRWRMTEKISFGQRTPSGRILGDFVDVAATVEIAMYTGKFNGLPVTKMLTDVPARLDDVMTHGGLTFDDEDNQGSEDEDANNADDGAV